LTFAPSRKPESKLNLEGKRRTARGPVGVPEEPDCTGVP
jgi:hypothetical protein